MNATTTQSTGSPSGSLLGDATRLGGVELTITDLERALDFYTRVLGLSVRELDDRSAALGAGGEDLVTLRVVPGARPAGRHAGLYHYALLFPSREELARVLDGVRQLPGDRREALIMRFALGMDNREIARALGRSDGATKVLIHRAIKQLEEIVHD